MTEEWFDDRPNTSCVVTFTNQDNTGETYTLRIPAGSSRIAAVRELFATTPKPAEDPLEARVLKLESDLDWLKGHVRGADDSLGNRLDAADRDLNALSERIETHTHHEHSGQGVVGQPIWPLTSTVESTPTSFRMATREPAEHSDAWKWQHGLDPETLAWSSEYYKCEYPATHPHVQDLRSGLVPRREVVVTDGDVEAARRMYVDASASGDPIPSTRVLRAVLDAFAVRLNERIVR